MKRKNIKNLFKRLLEKNPRPTTELNYSNNFTLLLAVVLSAQMTDTGVNKVTNKIFSLADSPEKIVRLGEIKIKSLIKTVNFFNTKAKNIINTFPSINCANIAPIKEPNKIVYFHLSSKLISTQDLFLCSITEFNEARIIVAREVPIAMCIDIFSEKSKKLNK